MLYFYQSTNPCICTSTPSDPPCPDDCNCIKICNIAINELSDDAVGPCAAQGSLDISDESYGHDFCACGENEVKWSIESYDKDLLINASITQAGVLTWTTAGPETIGQYPCVIVKVCCGNLSAYGFVLIGVKDLCYPCTCTPCEDCDPCTGLCTGGMVNASLKASDSSGNPSLIGS